MLQHFAYLLDMYGHMAYNLISDAMALSRSRRGETEMQVAERSAEARRGERLEARVSRATKALFQKAAEIQGRSLTDFVVSSAVEAATRTVQENEFMHLTQRDKVAFVEALLNAPAPNARLQKAAQRHAQVFAG